MRLLSTGLGQVIGFAPYSAFIGASIKRALYSIRSPLSSAHYSAHIDAHLLVLLNFYVSFSFLSTLSYGPMPSMPCLVAPY